MNKQEEKTPPVPTPAVPAPKAGGSLRVNVLDGYRGIACMMVVFYHQAQNIGVWPFKLWGFTGVHLFFILSGYLLGRPYLRCLLNEGVFPPSREFYLRRFIRIYPPYLISLIVFIALRFATRTNIPDTQNVITHVFLVFNYFDRDLFFSINGVFWTLAIEAQFYFLLPLLAWPLRVLRAKAEVFVAGLFALGMLARAVEALFIVPQPHVRIPVRFVSVFSFLDLFAFGMLIVLVQEKAKRRAAEKEGGSRWSTPLLLAIGVPLILLANCWCTFAGNGDWLASKSVVFTVFFPALLCLGYTCLLTATIQNDWGKRFFAAPPLVFLGAISYSIYLYHSGVQVIVGSVLPRFTGTLEWGTAARLSAFVSLPFILILAYVMYRLVEKPCLNWMERRKTPPPIASTPQNHVV